MPSRKDWTDYIPASGEARALLEVKGKVGKGAKRKGRYGRRYPEDDRKPEPDHHIYKRRGMRRFRMSTRKSFWDSVNFYQLTPGSAAIQEPGDRYVYSGGHYPPLYIYPKVSIPGAAVATERSFERPGHEQKMQLLRLQGDIWARIVQNQIAGEEGAPGRFPFLLVEWTKVKKSGIVAENLFHRQATPLLNETEWTQERLGDKMATSTAAGGAGLVSGGIPGHRVREDVIMRRVVHLQPTAAFYDTDVLFIRYVQKPVRIPMPRRPMTVLDADESCLVMSLQLFEYGASGAIPYTTPGAGDNRYQIELRTETLRAEWKTA